MKKISMLLLALFVICSCTTQKSPKKAESTPPLPVSSTPVQSPDKPVLAVKKDVKPLFGKLLKEVSISTSSMNPSHKEKVTISYLLSEPAKTIVNIYDPDLGLIKTISSEKTLQAGKQTFIWDGMDIDGKVCTGRGLFLYDHCRRLNQVKKRFMIPQPFQVVWNMILLPLPTSIHSITQSITPCRRWDV